MGIVTTIAPVALALIMLGLGASLTVKDFTRVAQNPKEFFVGLVCQLVLLPIVAYLLIIILQTPIELALGVMLIAAAPGGVIHFLDFLLYCIMLRMSIRAPA